MTKIVAVVCAALLTLTACGGGGDAEAKDNIAASLKKADTGLAGNSKLSDEQADCVAGGMVDDIGVDKLKDYGILKDDNTVDTDAQPDDLSADDADAMASTIVGCVDMGELLADQMGDQFDQLSEDQQKCVTDVFDDDTFEGILSDTFQGKTPEMGQDLQSKMMECMTPTQ